jgi:hypothetical protein
MRFIALAFLLVGLAALTAGCIFSPDKGDGGGGGGGTPQYPKLDSPSNVLDALGKSYAARDSMEYKTLYDSLYYVGTSQDLNDPPDTQVSTFRYADEVAHLAALQRSTTIASVFFDIGANWQRLASSDPSHPEWAEIQINSTHVQIYDGATVYEVLSNSPTTFSFIPTVKAPGDTLWKIVRWKEVGNSGNSGA